MQAFQVKDTAGAIHRLYDFLDNVKRQIQNDNIQAITHHDLVSRVNDLLLDNYRSTNPDRPEYDNGLSRDFVDSVLAHIEVDQDQMVKLTQFPTNNDRRSSVLRQILIFFTAERRVSSRIFYNELPY